MAHEPSPDSPPLCSRPASAKRRTRSSYALLLTCLFTVGWLGACSFQNFDELQEGGGDGDGSDGTFGDGDGSGGTFGDGDGDGDSKSTGGSASRSSGGQTGAGAEGGGTGEGGMGGENDTEPTNLLGNPSFEMGSTAGWTVTPASALTNRHVFVQFPTGTVKAPDGYQELAFWHGSDSFEIEISQKLENLETGTYNLSAFFTRGPGLTATLFAKSCSSQDPDPLEVPVTDANSFTKFTLREIEVTSDTCVVGITVSAAPTEWMNVDGFSFEKE